MRQRLPAGIALVVAWLIGSAGMASARLSRELRTGPDDSYVVFANGEPDSEIWMARAGATPAPVRTPQLAWTLDALVDDQGQLWLAGAADGRDGPVRLWWLSGGTAHQLDIPGSSASAEARLLFAGGAIELATPAGLWRVAGGSARKLASWKTDSYGFYAASLARSGHGWLLLVPTFNTCGSSDILEELALLEQGPGGLLERRAISLPPAPLGRVWLGADGWRYGVGCAGDVGLIGRHAGGTSWPIVHREPAPSCRYDLQQNDAFTIVRLGKTLLRLSSGRVERLGLAEKGAADIEAFQPDRRGRALVLYDDGAIVRYSSRRPPEQVGQLAPRAK